MKVKRIGSDHVDDTAAFVHAVAVVELHCAEVGEEQNIGGDFARDGKGRDLFRVFERGALAADSHGHADFLCGFGKSLVDFASLLCPAGHGTDQDGSGQGFPEQAEAWLDAFQIQLGQGLVDKMIFLQPGGQR